MDKNDNTFGAAAFQAAGNSYVLDSESSFAQDGDIDATRWNQSFPYQLLAVRKQPDGSYVRDYIWQFTLPIPPESLNISMPFASSVSATLGGVIEESNGAPFRTIALTGTTGLMPLKGNVLQPPRDVVLANSILGGVISRGLSVVDAAAQAGNDFGVVESAMLVDDSAFGAQQPITTTTGLLASTTGYYQFRLLQRFLEGYAQAKKKHENKDLRLVLAIHKDEAAYFVTPVSFTLNRSASSPLEYNYSLQFKAWKQAWKHINNISPAKSAYYKQDSAWYLQSLSAALKAFEDVMRFIQESKELIASVLLDWEDTIEEPLREKGLYLKDKVGSTLKTSDLPMSIVVDLEEPIKNYVKSAQFSVGTSEGSSDPKVKQAYAAIAETDLSTSTGNSKQARLPDDPFRAPKDYFAFFETIPVGMLKLSPTMVRRINEERSRVAKFNRLDFERMRDDFMKAQADIADALGIGNTTYNDTFGRVNRETTKTATDQDYQILFALNRAGMALNSLASTGKSNSFKFKPMDFVAGLASRSGIAFKVPRSKFSVPFPYGVTLEWLAYRYLGHPDRWIEIAALNGLRSPYVDEEGFDLPLVSKGRGNQVIVTDSSKLLVVGQQVWLTSANAATTARHIVKIDRQPDGNSVLTLDGDADLESYTVLGQANLHAYLPDTVNSQMTIYIPSDLDPGIPEFDTKPVPGLDVFDQLLTVGGYDLLLTSSNDLAITPDGDCRLAVGLTNIVQTARLRLSVVRGTLNRHPNYGLPIKPGMSLADMNADELLKAAKSLFQDDPTFTGVKAASVRVNGPTTSIMINVGVAGQAQTIPISLNIKT